MDFFSNPPSLYMDNLKEESFGYSVIDLEDTMPRSNSKSYYMGQLEDLESSIQASLENTSPTWNSRPQISRLEKSSLEQEIEIFNSDQLILEDPVAQDGLEVKLTTQSDIAIDSIINTKYQKQNESSEYALEPVSKPKARYISRPDVVNKGILRMAKTYFQDLLYEHCPDYKKKRL
jgi:hypothetical protein